MAMDRLRTFGRAALNECLAVSRTAPRRRTNLNVHPDLADPIQRLANLIQPGSYIRPHRHGDEKWELFVLLQGRAGVILFADDGAIEEAIRLGPEDAWAVEIPAGKLHTAFALETDTLLFEVKAGPYRPLADEDFAAWAPAEGDEAVPATLERWRKVVEGQNEAGC